MGKQKRPFGLERYVYFHDGDTFPIGNVSPSEQFVNTKTAKTCEKSSPYSDIEIDDFLENIREIVTSIIEENRRKIKKKRMRV